MRTELNFKAIMKYGAVAVLAGSVLFGADATAQQQTVESLAEQVNRLQKDIQVLSRQVYKGGTPPANLAANAPSASGSAGSSAAGGNAYIFRVEDRLSQLEQESRNNTGNIESLTHTLNEINSRLDKLVNDLNFRLSAIEKRLAGGGPSPAAMASGPAPAPAGPPQVRTVPGIQGVDRGQATTDSVLGSQPKTLGTISRRDLSSVQSAPREASQIQAAPSQQQAALLKGALPEGSPQEQYDFAYGLIRRAEYNQAAQAFQEFIEKHPKHELTSNARYWLGETHYVRKDYRQAAESFLNGYQDNPQGQKAPDNLLKLGMSLGGMQKGEQACTTFDKLLADFPNASDHIKRRVNAQRKKLGCG